MNPWSPRQLIAFLNRVEPALDRMNHFELLDIAHDADSEAVRAAFHRMASRLHPDLYRLHISAEDHERLTRVYAHVAEAYLVLRDPDARSEYSAATAVRAGAETALEASLPPRARTLYRRAQASLRRGDRASAVLELRMAVASAPHSAFLRDALSAAVGRPSRE